MRTRAPRKTSSDQSRAVAQYTWLTTGQAAARVGVKRPTIRKWIAEGRFSVEELRNVGGRRPEWRIRPDALDRVVTERTTEALDELTRKVNAAA